MHVPWKLVRIKKPSIKSPTIQHSKFTAICAFGSKQEVFAEAIQCVQAGSDSSQSPFEPHKSANCSSLPRSRGVVHTTTVCPSRTHISQHHGWSIEARRHVAALPQISPVPVTIVPLSHIAGNNIERHRVWFDLTLLSIASNANVCSNFVPCQRC